MSDLDAGLSPPLTSPITSPEERFDFNEDGLVSLVDVQLLLQRLVEPIVAIFDTDNNGKTNTLDFAGIHGFLTSMLPSPGASIFPTSFPSPQVSTYPTPRPSVFSTPRPTPSVSPRETLLVKHVGQFTEADDGFRTLILEHPQSWTWQSIKDLTTPVNYFNGTWHYRLTILADPWKYGANLGICIWDMPEKAQITCIKTMNVSGDGTYSSGKPSQTWTEIKGGPLDVTDTRDLRMSLVLFGSQNIGGTPTRCLVSKNNTMNYPSDRCEYQFGVFKDIRFVLTIVMVSEGGTFSGWNNYY